MVTFRQRKSQRPNRRIYGCPCKLGKLIRLLGLLLSRTLIPEHGLKPIRWLFGAARMLVGAHRATYPGGDRGCSQGL